MPIVFREHNDFHAIAVWESTEDPAVLEELARLSFSEKTDFESFKSLSRKREYVTVRALLRAMTPEAPVSIRYDKNGKPHPDQMKSMSISHTGNFVAVMLSERSACGLDMELIDERILRLAKKFVNDEEKKHLPEQNLIEHLQVLWGAKEVIFKIHGLGDLDFRKHMNVHAFHFADTGNLTAELKKEGFEQIFQVHYKQFGQLMLSWSEAD